MEQCVGGSSVCVCVCVFIFVLHLPPVSMRAHLHMQLSLSMSLVLKSAPWITRLLCLPAVPLWLFRNSLKHIKESGGGAGGGGGRGKPGSQGTDAHHGWWRGERSAAEWLACAIKTARRHNMLHGMSPEGRFVLCCDWVKVEHLEKHYEGRRKIK